MVLTKEFTYNIKGWGLQSRYLDSYHTISRTRLTSASSVKRREPFFWTSNRVHHDGNPSSPSFFLAIVTHLFALFGHTVRFARDYLLIRYRSATRDQVATGKKARSQFNIDKGGFISRVLGTGERILGYGEKNLLNSSTHVRLVLREQLVYSRKYFVQCKKVVTFN